MLKFSVPCDFYKETLAAYSRFNKNQNKVKIFEVYGQMTTGDFKGSGRMVDTLPKVNEEQLKEYLVYCRKYDMQFNYVLNGSCYCNQELIDSSREKLIDFIDMLYHIGIRSFTVAIPSIFNLLLNRYHDLELKASAICEINCVEKAIHYKKLGVGRIVLDPDITRKFHEIGKICKSFGNGVELIINNVCVRNCPYKMFHYNNEAHSNLLQEAKYKQYYYHMCALQKASDPINYMKINWVRPEDLDYYVNTGVTSFKLQGRNNPNSKHILRVVEHYLNRDYEGNLMDFISLFQPYNSFQPYIDNKKLENFIKPFYDNKDFCQGICENCGYCLGYLEKASDLNKVRATNALAYQLYDSSIREI